MTGWLKNYSPQRFLISFGLAAFIGSMASVASEVFVSGIAWINDRPFISPHSRDATTTYEIRMGFRHTPGNNPDWAKLLPWFTVLALIAGGLIGGGLLMLLRGNRPLGIPDVIFASQTGSRKIPVRTGLLTTLTDMTSIFAAMKKVEDFVGESVPVVSAEDHLKLVGVIPEGNIFKAYSDGIGEIRQEEYGDS
jgi:CBS domain-containing protein